MKKLLLISSLLIATTTFGQNACNFSASGGGLLNTVTFTPGTILNGYVYQWTFGDGTASSVISPVHVYNSTGWFTVCLSIWDSSQQLQCHFCDSIFSGNPAGGSCSFTTAVDTASNVADFVAQPSTPGSIITWDLGDGHTATGNLLTWQYAHDSTYTVCMTETDATSGIILCTSCGTVYTGPSNMNCSFSYYPDFANPSVINFIANTPAGSTVTWSFGDNTSGTGMGPHHTYNSNGYFLVCMTTVYNGVSCSYCDSIPVNILPVNCSFTYSGDPINSALITFVGAPSSPASGLIWDFGDGQQGQGSPVVHQYASSGTYNVCMSEYSNGAIVCVSCQMVHISINAPNCNANFVSASQNLTGYFIDLSNSHSASMTYSWSFGDGTASADHFPHHTYAIPGTYNVCLSIVDALTGCADHFCSTITVDTLINIPPQCSAYFVILQMAPYQLDVVNLSSGVNLNFDWDFGDGSAHESGAYPSHHYSNTGMYVLCLTVSDASGCSNQYCDTLSVDSLGNVTYRMLTGGFDINVVSPASITGVREIPSPVHFAVYPNPVSSTVTISVADEMKSSLTYYVYALDGSEISTGIFSQKINKLNVSEWNSGAYILEMRSPDGFRSYGKIIKQ